MIMSPSEKCKFDIPLGRALATATAFAAAASVVRVLRLGREVDDRVGDDDFRTP